LPLPPETPAARVLFVAAEASAATAHLPGRGAQSDATTARTGLDVMVKAIMDKRIAVQYAADAEWPHPNKANAGIRREFFLPPDRPFNVQTARGTPPSQPNT
jgi:hypothetical protein